MTQEATKGIAGTPAEDGAVDYLTGLKYWWPFDVANGFTDTISAVTLTSYDNAYIHASGFLYLPGGQSSADGAASFFGNGDRYMSVAWWVKLGYNGASVDKGHWWHYHTSSPTNYMIDATWLKNSVGSFFKTKNSGAGTNYYQIKGSPFTTAWTHHLIVIDTANLTRAFYLNGAPFSTSTLVAASLLTDRSCNYLRIGYTATVIKSNQYGYTGDFMAWDNRLLGDAEALAIYNDQKARYGL